MIGDLIFIGKKNNPTYMIEINKNKKLINIYKPDKYSLEMKDYIEQYTLGKCIYEIKYKKYFFKKNDCVKYINKYFYERDKVNLLSEIVFLTDEGYLWIKDDIYENTI
jgi:hypothetical protein